MEPEDVGWSAQVARTFGLGRVRGAAVEAARGRQGVVHRLETERGRWAVKTLLQPLDEEQAARDGGLAAAMADRGVRTPRPVRTAHGRFVASVGGRRVRVADWLDLDDPSTALDPLALGTLFGTLHRDPIRIGGTVDAWYTEAVGGEDWERLVADLRAAGCPFVEDLARAAERHLRLAAVFRAPGEVQACHRDLWADNVRGTPGGALAVVDWDNCGPAEAVQEACVGLVEFCRRSPARVRAFAEAYRGAGGGRMPSDRSDFTMVLAQFGHFVHTAGSWWLDATTDEERAAMSAWFHEDHDDPIDLDTLDGLLAALR